MSTDNDVPWGSPEPDEADAWQKPEPLPLPAPRKPNILPPSKREPFFRWIGEALAPSAPQCPKCGGPVEYRKRDDAAWCRVHDEYFIFRSDVEMLHAAGLWFL